MDGNRVLIGCADRYKIEDIDGGILTAAVMNEKDKPHYFVSPTGRIEEKIFSGTAEGFLLCKYIGVYKTEQAAIKNVSRCLKFWEEVRRK